MRGDKAAALATVQDRGFQLQAMRAQLRLSREQVAEMSRVRLELLLRAEQMESLSDSTWSKLVVFYLSKGARLG